MEIWGVKDVLATKKKLRLEPRRGKKKYKKNLNLKGEYVEGVTESEEDSG